MGDVGKELPEDAELENLVDMDIPGLVVPGELSFKFVEAEVREQLSHLSRQEQDTIVGFLGHTNLRFLKLAKCLVRHRTATGT